jgi:uncharacterized protein (TIGR00251 family)
MKAHGWCHSVAGGIRLVFQVSPNAKKTEVIGELEEALKIRLHAPPIEGRANEELVRFVAEQLGITRRAVTLTHGVASKRKVVLISEEALVPKSVVERFLDFQNR